MKVYERVRDYIEKNHLKQISVSRAAGISNPIFNAILHGKRILHADDLEKICKALNVSAEVFIPETDEKVS